MGCILVPLTVFSIIFRLNITEDSEVTQQSVILKDVFTIKLVSSFAPLLNCKNLRTIAEKT